MRQTTAYYKQEISRLHGALSPSICLGACGLTGTCQDAAVEPWRSAADGGEYADTYYITDSWGNPLMVIPPEATKALAGAGSAAQDADIVDNYCYTYRYDSQLRVISKKLPGAEAHVFAYDSEGRQAFSRDGNQYGRGRRVFALYDALGRVAVTGTCQDVDEEWWSQPSSSRPAMTARRSASVYGIRLAAEPVFAQAGAGLGHSGVYSGVDGGAQRILAAVRGRVSGRFEGL